MRGSAAILRGGRFPFRVDTSLACMYTEPMTHRSAQRTQFLTDVLTTAVEGGIQYWASVTAYEWEDVTTPYVEFFDHEDFPDYPADDYASEGGPRVFRVTIDDIARALGRFMRDEDGCRFYTSADLRQANRTNGEDGDYDAGDADCILQIAALGEIVYG